MSYSIQIDLVIMTDLRKPRVAVIMGSNSDMPTMQECLAMLEELKIAYEVRIVSAHRTPKLLEEYVEGLEGRGIKVLIAAAGGAAHLAGVAAALTILPVLGVPMKTSSLGGNDSLLSMVQMPAGIPVPTMAIGRAGAINSALSAGAILALEDAGVREELLAFRKRQAEKVERMFMAEERVGV